MGSGVRVLVRIGIAVDVLVDMVVGVADGSVVCVFVELTVSNEVIAIVVVGVWVTILEHAFENNKISGTITDNRFFIVSSPLYSHFVETISKIVLKTIHIYIKAKIKNHFMPLKIVYFTSILESANSKTFMTAGAFLLNVVYADRLINSALARSKSRFPGGIKYK